MNRRKETNTSPRTGKPKQGKQGEGGGRPKLDIDYETVKKLASIQCTQNEISAWLDISVDTLVKDVKFVGIYKSAIESGKMSLRRHQWKALEAGNTTMLVWLGKQYLRQTEKQEITGAEGKEMIIRWLPSK